MTKYYRLNEVYVGGFDGAQPPAGSVEVPFPPKDARFIWDGNLWIEPPNLKPVLVDEKRESEVVKQGVTLDDKVNALWLKANADDAEFNRIDAIIKKAESDFPKP